MADAYTPYASREGYSDLQPIPQPDAPNCLVPIAYTEQYRDAMDTFRALVAKQERSDRTLEVTGQLIRMNPGHYSIWAYRAETLLALKKNLSEELNLMDELVREHIKSYQVWQHRRTIVLALGSSARELPFTARALTLDTKNYHTWAYRQWVLCHFFFTPTCDKKERDGIWAAELEYTAELLRQDVRNNSAWNHRFFVAFESDAAKDRDMEKITEQEISFTKEQLALVPNNPSAWSYLRGILTRTSTPLASLTHFVTPLALNTPNSMPSTEPSISTSAELPCAQAVEFLADAAAEEGLKSESQEKKEEAVALFKSLCQFDPIRTNYWMYRAAEVAAL